MLVDELLVTMLEWHSMESSLVVAKEADKTGLDAGEMTDELIRIREEVSEQIKALKLMKEMAANMDSDISRPAETAQEAFQWVYFAYLAALKEHDGAAMSLGNLSSFLDVYVERDMAAGKLDEAGAQELVDHFIMKLRMIRHLRMSEYDHLFAGIQHGFTESIGGMFMDGKHKVTKNSVVDSFCIRFTISDLLQSQQNDSGRRTS